MAQNWEDNTYQSNHILTTDYRNAENNFICLKTTFSGGSNPTNTEIGMNWYDSNKKINKFRNSSNNNWLCLMPLNNSSKIWMYRNDVVLGMVIDTNTKDLVVGIKATSGHYNITGGNEYSTWETLQHYHGPGSFIIDDRHKHEYSSIDLFITSPPGSHTTWSGALDTPLEGLSGEALDADWRPPAAVGTLQKMDS